LLTSQGALKDVEEYSRSTKTPIIEVSGEVFQSLSGKDGPQGIGAVVRESFTKMEDIVLQQGDIWVALDSIADPGNLGTILRTNDSAGGKGIFLLDHCTDPYDPSAVRGSMGALFSQKIVKTTLSSFSAWINSNHYPVVGTSDKAEHDYHKTTYPNPIILLMGSERMGLTPAHLELCKDVVAIPMRGRSDSLNLAVATGIVLYEIVDTYRDVEKLREIEQ
jgi:RNA methyltransferase, TrmH family